jgi:hypothetical protein
MPTAGLAAKCPQAGRSCFLARRFMHHFQVAGFAGLHWGKSMRKSVLVLAVVMIAAAPATALAAKKKAAAPADPNANAKKFVTAAWQQPGHVWKGMWTPWWAAKK